MGRGIGARNQPGAFREAASPLPLIVGRWPTSRGVKGTLRGSGASIGPGVRAHWLRLRGAPPCPRSSPLDPPGPTAAGRWAHLVRRPQQPWCPRAADAPQRASRGAAAQASSARATRATSGPGRLGDLGATISTGRNCAARGQTRERAAHEGQGRAEPEAQGATGGLLLVARAVAPTWKVTRSKSGVLVNLAKRTPSSSTTASTSWAPSGGTWS